MIDKSGEYWHLHFSEYCDDNPEAILALTEKLYAEIAEMGDVWFIRGAPQISRETFFGEEAPLANVFCRFSAKPTISKAGESIVTIGLAPIDPKKFCDKCGSELEREPTDK